MALSVGVVTVTTTPTELTVVDADNRVDSDILVGNNSAATVYVGDASVTASAGFPVAVGASFSYTVRGERLYAVVASGTAAVNVFRGGV